MSTSTICVPPENKIKLCRFCAQEQSSRTDFIDLSTNEEIYDKCIVILEYFKIDFINISIEDHLPKVICEHCYRSMESSHKFFKKVEESQSKLLCMEIDVKLEDYSENHNLAGDKIKLEKDFNSVSESIPQPINEIHFCKSTWVPVSKKQRSNSRHQMSGESGSDEDFVYAGCPVFNEVEIYKPHSNDIKSDEIKFEYSVSEEDESDFGEFLYAGYPMFTTDHDKAWSYYKWKCRHCQLRFESIPLLRTHSAENHNTCLAFTCDSCSLIIQSFEQFAGHIRSHRPNLKHFCIYCDHYNNTVEECISHEDGHTSFFRMCEFCGEQFKDNISLTQHINQFALPKPKEEEHKAEESDNSLSSVDFDVPLETIGSKIPPSNYVIKSWADYPWICPQCQLSFESLDQWRSHMKVKHNRCAGYRCFDCKRYRCRKLRHLIGHIRQHRENLKLQCYMCFETKQTEGCLRKHMSGHLRDYYWCELCDEKFTEEKTLKEHKQKYKAPKLIKRRISLSLEELTCKVCNKVSKNERCLKLHLSIHENSQNFACEICGLTFNTKSNLSDHLLRHDKQYVCDICKKAFARKCHIIRHIATHLDSRPFTCEECGHKCRHISALRQHKIKHMKSLPFVCVICNKGFKTASYHKRHQVQHTGEKPYKCKFCNTAFANSANCHKHMKRIHGSTRPQ